MRVHVVVERTLAGGPDVRPRLKLMEQRYSIHHEQPVAHDASTQASGSSPRSWATRERSEWSGPPIDLEGANPGSLIEAGVDNVTIIRQ